jgi:hypothetical protein
MGVAGTLPDDLIPEAMNMAVYLFLAGRGGSDISKGRETLFNSADRTRREIASVARSPTQIRTTPRTRPSRATLFRSPLSARRCASCAGKTRRASDHG